MIGKTLGHYQITAPLGKGGMGEVFRARDAHLDRDVALKILPDEFANDPERLARFRREAKVLASVNHPNIAVLHGLEQDGNVVFLVMEVAEGQDLLALMEHGPLPLEDALPIAAGIAAGLEEAHDKGIVHRDLKPANVVVAHDGKVKILDFGLASAYSGDCGDETNVLNSPTITQAFTQPGTMLGTAAYMSPEQARGKPLDKRTDIWSFGIILYEMLTGDRVYHGETVTDTLAGILTRSPDLEKLPEGTPASVRRLLSRCLDKDHQLRLRDIGEARIALLPEVLGEEAPSLGPVAATPDSSGARMAWAVAAVAVLAAVLLGALTIFQNDSMPPAEIRASIEPPADAQFAAMGLQSGSLSISPDGALLTFAANVQGSPPQLFLRSLDSDQAQPLGGTENASFPFWSPSGQQLAFFSGGKLKKLSLSGGAPFTICDASEARGGTWNRDDVILFAPATQAPIHRVSASGGEAVPVTRLDADRGGESTHRFPWFLPDGRSFLYVRASHSASSGDPVNSVWLASLDSDETRELMPSVSNAAFARGHVFWVQEGFLMARPFDLSRLEFTGESFSVGEGVLHQPNYLSLPFIPSGLESHI